MHLSDDAKSIGLDEKTIINDGVSLEQVLHNLDVELQQLSGSIVLVADGPNALRQVLHPHCARHHCSLPDRFYEFVDLRKCFVKAYPGAGKKSANPTSSSPSSIAGLMILPIQAITSLEQMIAGQSPFEIQTAFSLNKANQPTKLYKQKFMF